MKENTIMLIKKISFGSFVFVVAYIMQSCWTYILGTYASKYIFANNSTMLFLAIFSFIAFPTIIFSLIYCYFSKGKGQGLIFFWSGISTVAINALSINTLTVIFILVTVLVVGILTVKLFAKELADDYKQII